MYLNIFKLKNCGFYVLKGESISVLKHKPQIFPTHSFILHDTRVRLGSKTREMLSRSLRTMASRTSTRSSILPRKHQRPRKRCRLSWPHGSHQRVTLTVHSLTRLECETRSRSEQRTQGWPWPWAAPCVWGAVSVSPPVSALYSRQPLSSLWESICWKLRHIRPLASWVEIAQAVWTTSTRAK